MTFLLTYLRVLRNAGKSVRRGQSIECIPLPHHTKISTVSLPASSRCVYEATDLCTSIYTAV